MSLYKFPLKKSFQRFLNFWVLYELISNFYPHYIKVIQTRDKIVSLNFLLFYHHRGVCFVEKLWNWQDYNSRTKIVFSCFLRVSFFSNFRSLLLVVCITAIKLHKDYLKHECQLFVTEDSIWKLKSPTSKVYCIIIYTNTFEIVLNTLLNAGGNSGFFLMHHMTEFCHL